MYVNITAYRDHDKEEHVCRYTGKQQHISGVSRKPSAAMTNV